MNVDAMRSIDYYVGVPLCYLATIFCKIVAMLSPKRLRPVQKVVLIELSEMGSAIICDPALQKLKSNGKELFFLIFKKNAGSLKLLNTIPEDHVFTIRESSLFVLAWDTLRFFKWARQNRIDSCIDLELFSRFTALLSAFCGASHVVGFHRYHNEGLYRGDMLTRQVAYNPHQHIAKNFIALVNALLSPVLEHPYSKTVVAEDEIKLKPAEVDDSALASVRQSIRSVYSAFESQKIILMNTGGGEFIPQRRWPPEYYIQLIKNILNDYPTLLILLTGGPWEKEEVERISSQVKSDRCINFSGLIKFNELTALYSMAECMLTNDSGPAHFSSVTDLKTYIFYGPETPALYGPLKMHKKGPDREAVSIYSGMSCSPCVTATNHRKTTCRDNQCLKIISPTQIYAMLRPHFEA